MKKGIINVLYILILLLLGYGAWIGNGKCVAIMFLIIHIELHLQHQNAITNKKTNRNI